MKLLVQNLQIGGKAIQGPLVGIDKPADIINKIMPLVISAGVIVLFFTVVLGGYGLLLSRGNPEKIKSAQAKLTTGIVGFVLLIVAYLIVRLISSIFGLGKGLF